MRRTTLGMLAVVFALAPTAAFSQMAMSPKAATYITDEQVKAINALPGVDRQIVSQDIGKLNEAVGIIHRGPTGGARGTAGAGAGGGANAAAGGAGRGAPQGEPCGEMSSAPAGGGTPGGISHDGQTETYIIVSGGGTLVTGGHIVNGRKSPADSEVTKVLNGPSCSGAIAGADVVKKVVKTGDIIIIPAGVPHGWTEITDHVDYLSVRPDPDRVLSNNYVNPALKK
jgi:hypothetical protein